MRRALVVTLALVLAACATAPPRVTRDVRELAGAWRGRLAVQGANASASLAIKEDGAFTGTMHFERDERPFTGAIIVGQPGRLRYVGSLGEGTVLASPEGVPPTTLRFVPDGGGGGGTLTRVQ